MPCKFCGQQETKSEPLFEGACMECVRRVSKGKNPRKPRPQPIPHSRPIAVAIAIYVMLGIYMLLWTRLVFIEGDIETATYLTLIVGAAMAAGIAIGKAVRGRPWEGAALALLFSFLGLIFVFLLKDKRPHCPACRKPIDPAASTCPYCRTRLGEDSPVLAGH